MERESVGNKATSLETLHARLSVGPGHDQQLSMVWCCLQWGGSSPQLLNQTIAKCDALNGTE